MATATAPITTIAPPPPDTKVSRVLRWQQGETPGPWEMQVHPTNRCNLKCRHCWERRAEIEIGMSIYDKAQEISDERFLRLVDEAAEMGVREWTIVGGGEPMVRGELVLDMCERIHGHGMQAAIHTNATRFNGPQFERILEMGLYAIRVSIDGPTQELNDLIRGGGYNKAVENLRLLRDMKRAAGAAAPAVSLHPVLTNATWNQIDTLVELTHDVGAESVYLSHLIFEKDDEPGVVFKLTAEQMTQLPFELEKGARRAAELGIQNNFQSLMPDPVLYTKDEPFVPRTCRGDGSMMDSACFEAQLTCIVHVNGQVGPCCVSYDDDADNIKEASLRDVWLGPYMTKVRERLKTNTLMPYCAQCPTYIEPRSVGVRYGLLDHERKHPKTSAPWGDMGWLEKSRTLAARTGDSLRSRGVGPTVRRAIEWIRMPRG